MSTNQIETALRPPDKLKFWLTQQSSNVPDHKGVKGPLHVVILDVYLVNFFAGYLHGVD